MTIGENIRRIRKEKNLTQKALGELCGINEANIRKYELGGANPKLSTLKKIADGLCVDVNELLESTIGLNATENTSQKSSITNAFNQQKNTPSTMSDKPNNDTIQLINPSTAGLRALVKSIAPELYPDILSKFDTNTSEGRKAARSEIMKFLAASGELSVLYFDNSEYSSEELQKIQEYAEFLKSQRKN